jgi:uncharacterized protein YcaQ
LPLTKETVRRLMLEKQGIGRYPDHVDKALVYDTVNRLGCLQIDTINVVERAHYLTLWTRLGMYHKDDLHDLAYRDRRLFEYWAHSACYVPTKDYRYYIKSMNLRREEMRARFSRRSKADPKLLDRVLKRVQNEGALSSKDFEGPRRKGGWWNWKPAKLALELLFGAGIFLIDRRENFQRYYDLAENVLPNSVDTSEPGEDERVRFFALKTMSCMGLVKPQEIRKYYHPWSIHLDRTSRQLQKLLDMLVSEGQAVKHSVEGEKTPYYCLPGDEDRLEELGSGYGFDEARLFVYFDNMMWNRERIMELFGFEGRLETYVPKDQRVYGYYHLPVLYGDRLVARVDPKMDRENNVMTIRGYWVEDGFKPTEHYEDMLAENIELFAGFHGADDIEWNV